MTNSDNTQKEEIHAEAKKLNKSINMTVSNVDFESNHHSSTVSQIELQLHSETSNSEENKSHFTNHIDNEDDDVKKIDQIYSQEEIRYGNFYERQVAILQHKFNSFISRNVAILTKCIFAIILMLYNAYFIYANFYNYKYRDYDHIKSLNMITGLTYAIIIILIVCKYFGQDIGDFFKKMFEKILYSPKIKKNFMRSLYLLIFLGIIVFLIVDVGLDTLRLRSALGMVILFKLVYITSTNPARVNWRPVAWGIGLQILFGFLILRWQKGYAFFELFGNKTIQFLNYANNGSIFLFGKKGLIDHPFAMQIFPVVIYFSAFISILYHWGVMQKIIQSIAWCMQYTMGTTAIETLSTTLNIFVGMAESCVVFTPFLPHLTKSELHAVLTGGFATVAGSYMAILISIGVDSVHLMSAAFMSAPAALAIAKLNYPETEESSIKSADGIYLDSMPAKSFIEAASNGAIDALKIVACVAANLIAILGILAFTNSLLSWFGEFIDHPEFSFEILCSYVFFPLTIIMGVPISDCRKVGQIIGKKIFVDELLSFQEIIELIKNNEISDRGAMIAIYSSCGFGSIAAVGIYIGAMVAVAPSIKSDIVKLAPRAMINGNIAGFMTACIAGVLYNEKNFQKSVGVAISDKVESVCPCCPCLGNYSIVWWEFIERWTGSNNSLLNKNYSVNFK